MYDTTNTISRICDYFELCKREFNPYYETSWPDSIDFSRSAAIVQNFSCKFTADWCQIIMTEVIQSVKHRSETFCLWVKQNRYNHFPTTLPQGTKRQINRVQDGNILQDQWSCFCNPALYRGDLSKSVHTPHMSTQQIHDEPNWSVVLWTWAMSNECKHVALTLVIPKLEVIWRCSHVHNRCRHPSWDSGDISTRCPQVLRDKARHWSLWPMHMSHSF